MLPDYTYMMGIFRDAFDKNSGIIFSESGSLRLAEILGGIRALGHTKEYASMAEEMYADLQSQMIRLRARDKISKHVHGLTHNPPQNVPMTICELADDGTHWGFSFCMYSIAADQADRTVNGRRKMFDFLGEAFAYDFVYNGGLLYHGPGGGETFAVCIDNPQYWSVHT